MPALPIRVTFLGPSGEVLGAKVLRPHNTNFRLLGTQPRVTIYPRSWTATFPHRDCVRYGDGWAVRLTEEDPLPLKLEPVDATTKCA